MANTLEEQNPYDIPNWDQLSKEEQQTYLLMEEQLKQEGLTPVESDQTEVDVDDKFIRQEIYTYMGARAGDLGERIDFGDHARKANTIASEYLREHPDCELDHQELASYIEEQIRQVFETEDTASAKQRSSKSNVASMRELLKHSGFN